MNSIAYYSIQAKNMYKEYQGLKESQLKALAKNGDIEAEIYVDSQVGCLDMEATDGVIPNESLQALKRSSEKGCPLSQYNLAKYLRRLNSRDETAILLLQKAAKSGLLIAHYGLGTDSLCVIHSVVLQWM
jgi:TPR repeat protein